MNNDSYYRSISVARGQLPSQPSPPPVPRPSVLSLSKIVADDVKDKEPILGSSLRPIVLDDNTSDQSVSSSSPSPVLVAAVVNPWSNSAVIGGSEECRSSISPRIEKRPCTYLDIGCNETFNSMHQFVHHVKKCKFKPQKRKVKCYLPDPTRLKLGRCLMEIKEEYYMAHAFLDHGVTNGNRVVQTIPFFIKADTVIREVDLPLCHYTCAYGCKFLTFVGLDPDNGSLNWWSCPIGGTFLDFYKTVVTYTIKHPLDLLRTTWSGPLQWLKTSPEVVMEGGRSFQITRKAFQSFIDHNPQTHCSEWVLEVLFEQEDVIRK